jgi:hypothetical protein
VNQATMFRHHGFFAASTGFRMTGEPGTESRFGANKAEGSLFFGALKRATRSFPGVGEGNTSMAEP